MRTELGRSQVEVQQCALSSEGPRLKSSLAKSWQGNSGLSSEVGEELGRRVGKAEVEEEVDADSRGETGGGGGGGGEQL